MGPKVLAVVIARGGSKGFPGKHLKLCASRPVVWWAINAISQSNLSTKKILSTDSEEIAAVAHEFLDVEVQMRPAYLAGDNVSGCEPLRYVYEQEVAKGYEYDILATIQGDTPLFTGYALDKAIAVLSSNYEAKSLIGAVRVLNRSSMHNVDDKGFASFLFDDNPSCAPMHDRQHQTPAFVMCGGMHLAKTPLKPEGNLFVTNKTLSCELPVEYGVCDIHGLTELTVADRLLALQGPETRFDNVHAGKRAWVIGTGPSLANITPPQWQQIDSDITIGINNLPSYHQTDYLLAGESRTPIWFKSFRTSQAVKFIIEEPRRQFDYPCIRFKDVKHPTFKLSQGLMTMGTSTHAALNLALIMGCDPVILLGVDYNSQTHITPQADDDPNHPYLYADAAIENFKKFVPHAKHLKRTIINGNPDSALECFSKQSVAEILANGRPD